MIKSDASRVGEIYEYDNGQALVVFVWNGNGDGFAWSEKRQQRLANYRTLKDVVAAYNRSNNNDGAYGCAELAL